MGRTKGSKNKEVKDRTPHTVELTTEGKLELIANLIVDHIVEDQSEGTKLLSYIEKVHAARHTKTA
jgi:hypothetical protein